MINNRPGVGTGVLIINENGWGKEVLLGLRKGSHGAGLWALVGGHVEYGETFAETCIRETLEEIGVTLHMPSFVCVVNEMIDDKHYADIIMRGYITSEPKILEDDKISELKWFPMDSLPENIYPSTKAGIKAHLSGLNLVDLLIN